MHVKQLKDPPTGLHLQTIINSVPELVCTLNHEGIFLFVNQAAETVLGFQADELIGKSCTDLVVPDDREKTIRAVEFMAAGVELSNFHNRYRKKNGSIIQLSWSARKGDDSAMIYCTARNATEVQRVEYLRTQYEKKLKEHHGRLLDILERIGEGFIAIDEDDRVIYWNRQAEIISGKSREEVLTRNIWECYPDLRRTPFYNSYHRSRQEQKPQQYEVYYETTQTWLEVVIYPSGNGSTGFFRDITERKNIEQRLEEQKRENQKKITAAVIQAQEKERAQVSLELHDNVNQVLTTVKLYNELCMNGIGGKELMEKSTVLLQSCINEIRSLSRQLSAPSLGNIRMKDSIKDLVNTIATTGKTTISLDTDGIRDLEVGPDMHLGIYRILQEHLTNILRHSEASWVKIVIDMMDEELIIKVSDNGKGFNINEKRSGIGISNMISRAESLGGRLTVNSAPGLGCVLIAHFFLGNISAGD